MTNNSKKFKKKAFSKAPLKNFGWGSSSATVFPDFSFHAVLTMVDNDPVARGAVNHFIDRCMEGEYSLIRKDTKVLDNDAEKRLEEKYNFRTDVLRKIFLAGKLFNNVFLELVKDLDGRTKAINILDSSDIEPRTEPNGDPIEYFSKTPNQLTGEKPNWKKDEIVWFKFGDRTIGYAPLDMKALWENLLTKHYVRRYVAWLWKTGQYRVIYGFENSSDQDIKDFLVYARKNDQYFDVPFIAKGALQTNILRDMKETESFIDLLKYLDNQTLILLRVPPNDAGIPDASGRSNADAQSNNLSTAVISMKKVVEDGINYKLFPKIGRGTYLFKFGPVDRFAVKQVFEILQIMHSMNMEDDTMKEFLSDRGIYFSSEKLFKEPEQSGMSAVINPRSNDMAPSRLGKGTGEGNAKDTGATTREDQLKKV